MNANYDSIQRVLKKFLSSMEELRKLNVLTNKKDFTCQIGEWLVALLYGGMRAKSGIQKDWDIEIGQKHLQVKAHAKAFTTKARWSRVNYSREAIIDELIIVVFSHDYKLKEFYKVPWAEALPKIVKSKKRGVIYWNHIRDFKIEIDSLPNQDIISLFK